MDSFIEQTNNWELAILVAVLLLLIFFWYYKFLFILTPNDLPNSLNFNINTDTIDLSSSVTSDKLS
jgi:hypothetical protein